MVPSQDWREKIEEWIRGYPLTGSQTIATF